MMNITVDASFFVVPVFINLLVQLSPNCDAHRIATVIPFTRLMPLSRLTETPDF